MKAGVDQTLASVILRACLNLTKADNRYGEFGGTDMIEVRLFATFRIGRAKILFLEAKQYATAGAIIDALEIPREEVAILLVNGRHSKADKGIEDGDIVALFPPVGGG